MFTTWFRRVRVEESDDAHHRRAPCARDLLCRNPPRRRAGVTRGRGRGDSRSTW